MFDLHSKGNPMAGLRLFKASVSLTALLVTVVAFSGLPGHAGSTVIDGPGFKVEKRQGWFGRKSSSYNDALGNTVEKKTGLFGRESSRTRVFGSEAVKNGNNIMVNGPDGQPLISKKKTLFGGEQTRIDGNGILDSIQQIFNNPNPNNP
jgi:hypothetical protein